MSILQKQLLQKRIRAISKKYKKYLLNERFRKSYQYRVLHLLNYPITSPNDTNPPQLNYEQIVGPWLAQQTSFDHPAHFETFNEYHPPDPNIFHDGSFEPHDPLDVSYKLKMLLNVITIIIL